MEARLPTENEIWYIINAYFAKYGAVRHQIESFDNFITFTLPQIVQESSEIRVKQGTNQEHVITMCNLSVQNPRLRKLMGPKSNFAHMARLRGLTYMSNIMVDVVLDIQTQVIGYEWKDVGKNRPIQGIQLFSEQLVKMLKKSTTLTQDELSSLDLKHLVSDHYIKVNDTYFKPIEEVTKTERRLYREVSLCKLPIMIGSCACYTQKAEKPYECRLDQGGYFICNGIEKVMLGQEKLHTNTPTFSW